MTWFSNTHSLLARHESVVPAIIHHMNNCGILFEDYTCGPTNIVGTQEDSQEWPTKGARKRLEAAITAVVAVETPIELDALAKKVGKRFGYQRVAQRWTRAITYRIPGGALVNPSISPGTLTRPLPEHLSISR